MLAAGVELLVELLGLAVDFVLARAGARRRRRAR
jgi:hypothetical protein